MLDKKFWDTILVKILSIEEVRRTRRNIQECAIETHPKVQCAEREE
jgi:hypothetical protein